MDTDRYLERVGVDPDAARRPTLETLRRLQGAHVTTVPFETLSITGEPHGDHEGQGVSLSLPHLYEKIVERELGGFCFELNGLFAELLAELGFEVDRLAARVIGDGDRGPPANHLTVRVRLDRPYLVDVGLGLPKMRRPLPIGGRVDPDAAGVEWRTAPSDRPDADRVVQTRSPHGDGWEDRYQFDATPRELSYFEATCEHLATAPESTFTGEPVVNVATDRGHAKLTPNALIRVADGEERREPVGPEAWHDVLESEFGLRYPVGRGRR